MPSRGSGQPARVSSTASRLDGVREGQCGFIGSQTGPLQAVRWSKSARGAGIHIHGSRPRAAGRSANVCGSGPAVSPGASRRPPACVRSAATCCLCSDGFFFLGRRKLHCPHPCAGMLSKTSSPLTSLLEPPDRATTDGGQFGSASHSRWATTWRRQPPLPLRAHKPHMRSARPATHPRG